MVIKGLKCRARFFFLNVYFTLYAFTPGSHTDEGGHDEEKSNYPGWRDQVGGRRTESLEDKESRMEERKTKVLNMLSKLQDDTPQQSKSSKGHSDFEDCEFILKI